MVSDNCIRQVLGVQSSTWQGKQLGIPHLREAFGTDTCFKNKVTYNLMSSFYIFNYGLGSGKISLYCSCFNFPGVSTDCCRHRCSVSSFFNRFSHFLNFFELQPGSKKI